MSANEDIVARLRSRGEGCTCNAWGGYECGCGAAWGDNYVLEAADEIERLRKEAREERASSKTFQTLLLDATDELERIAKERNGWQAQAAGISEDLSNAEDEIERLQEEINDLRLQVVKLSIPKEVRHD